MLQHRQVKGETISQHRSTKQAYKCTTQQTSTAINTFTLCSKVRKAYCSLNDRKT